MVQTNSTAVELDSTSESFRERVARPTLRDRMAARLGERRAPQSEPDEIPWPEVVEETASRAQPLRPWLREVKAIPDCMLDPMRHGQRPTGSYLGTGESIIKAQNRRDYLGGTLTEAEWNSLLEAFGNKCAYCRTSRNARTIEHVVPIVAGGRTCLDNIVPSCVRCNVSKSQKSLDRWRGVEWAAAFRERWRIALETAKAALRGAVAR